MSNDILNTPHFALFNAPVLASFDNMPSRCDRLAYTLRFNADTLFFTICDVYHVNPMIDADYHDVSFHLCDVIDCFFDTHHTHTNLDYVAYILDTMTPAALLSYVGAYAHSVYLSHLDS